ncbi:YraN family protein [Pseudoalteromonas sp. MMG005]|uniref:YraN family protein n=1 Tax=Pseudoalteromonas sp. MMG005 TaxID=2822682 RepID=UPI001B39E816|nr:YraN family protein [Pseudoalteromonas sp. MMG005]MBQ4847050.1 YraN family protein [Pseudoalteromonas sp. MMG005]
MLKGLFSNSRDKGSYYERLAESYLQQRGLIPETNNYYCRYGEIDLIMRDNNTLVFIEVKYRKHTQFGGALSALSYKKQQRLKRSIYQYLTEQQLHNTQVRVDFVAIEGENPPNIQWIKSVF